MIIKAILLIYIIISVVIFISCIVKAKPYEELWTEKYRE